MMFPERSENDLGFCPFCPPKIVISEGNNEVIRPVTVMKYGVYNGALKDVDALRASVRFWEGKEIILDTNDENEFDHPKMGIVTNLKQVVGQVKNVHWDETQSRIRADAHFYQDRCPEWLYNRVSEGNSLGVSGAFFCDKMPEKGIFEGIEYDRIETNYLPNNLAIVSRPACKLPDCGINTNSISEGNTTGDLEMTENVVNDSVKSEAFNININIPEINKQSIIKSEGFDGGDKMVSEEDFKKLEVEVNSLKEVAGEKDKTIVSLEAIKVSLESENKELKGKLHEIEVARMSEQFLGQFPEVNRERAKTELLPIFLERPAEVVLNAEFKKLLMVESPVAQGAEFVVPMPEMNAEDKMAKELGVPELDIIKKQLGI